MHYTVHYMRKSHVYSWRVSEATKKTLEREARRLGVSTAEILERAVRGWVAQRRRDEATDTAEQARLHAEAERVIGTIRGLPPDASTRARDLVRARLAGQRRARS